jgi:hypothetical protein
MTASGCAQRLLDSRDLATDQLTKARVSFPG